MCDNCSITVVATGSFVITMPSGTSRIALNNLGNLRPAAGIALGNTSTIEFVGETGEIVLGNALGFRYTNTTTSTGAIAVQTCYLSNGVVDSATVSSRLTVVRPAR